MTLPALRVAEPPAVDRLHVAALAFLSRYKPSTRRVYANVIRTYTGWCRLNGLEDRQTMATPPTLPPIGRTYPKALSIAERISS